MKITIPAFVAGTFLLVASQLLGQTSGTAHPDSEDSITVTAPSDRTVVVTEAPATAPALSRRPATEEPIVYGPYKPYAPAGAQTAEVTRPVLQAPAIDPADAGIVTSLPYSPTELSEGTMFKARLNEKISTATTTAGTRFSARISENVEHGGVVIFPAGSMLDGRITSVRGGHRIHGAAAIHLEPETVTLPDGTFYRLSAQVVNTDQYHNAKVNSEGTILRSDHFKRTLTEVGLATGAAAVAGAVIAGGPGAAVGAGVGAGIGTIWWLKQDRQQTLNEGTQITFSLNRPMELTLLAKSPPLQKCSGPSQQASLYSITPPMVQPRPRARKEPRCST